MYREVNLNCVIRNVIRKRGLNFKSIDLILEQKDDDHVCLVIINNTIKDINIRILVNHVIRNIQNKH